MLAELHHDNVNTLYDAFMLPKLITSYDIIIIQFYHTSINYIMLHSNTVIL